MGRGVLRPVHGPDACPSLEVEASHEPDDLLPPSLSSIPNGGEGARRAGEEALVKVQRFTARNLVWETSHSAISKSPHRIKNLPPIEIPNH